MFDWLIKKEQCSHTKKIWVVLGTPLCPSGFTDDCRWHCKIRQCKQPIIKK